LIASKSCEALDRDRFKLEFTEPDIEGVLDGGHNMLATAIFMVATAAKSLNESPPKIKTWDDLIPEWDKYREVIESIIEEFRFYMPVEIKYAKDNAEGVDLFSTSILDISQARNNNRELALEAKSNKAGHYEYLQKALDPNISKDVEWRTNSGGRLRVREIVALATIPLSKVQADIPELRKISPVMIYRNKGFCLKIFESLMNNDQVAKQVGPIRQLHHDEIKSALNLMSEIPELVDWIYSEFPAAYNNVSSRFAGISSVRVYHPGKKDYDSKKHIRTRPKTRFYQHEVKYDYPDGFITPLIWGLSELIESDGKKLSWKVNLKGFFEEHFEQLMTVYYGMIQMASYDPQGVGKNAASYSLIAQLIRSNLEH